MTRPRALAAAAVAAAALALGACGSDDPGSTDPVDLGPRAEALEGAQAEAATAIEDYIVAFQSGDIAGICELTSQGDPKREKSCAADLEGFEGLDQPEYELRSMETSGDRATARLAPTGEEGKPTVFVLLEIDGRWYVESNSLF